MTLQQNAHTDATNINPGQLAQDTENTHTQANTKPKTTLERLKQQQRMLANRIQQVESRQRENERKQETRRKILVGAYFLDKARQAGHMNDLIKQISTFLTRDSDKALFGLSIVKHEDTSK